MLRNSIVVTLVAILLNGQGDAATAQEPLSPVRFPAADNADAWNRLPQVRPALPIWARVLVEPLPKATASLLELDYIHRSTNPLGPVLAGKLRWVVAHTIGCAYARQYAEADLRRAGLSDDDLRQLTGDRRDLPESDRAVLAFARQLTRAGHDGTDDEMAALIRQFGPDAVVAIVHSLACGSDSARWRGS